MNLDWFSASFSCLHFCHLNCCYSGDLGSHYIVSGFHRADWNSHHPFLVWHRSYETRQRPDSHYHLDPENWQLLYFACPFILLRKTPGLLIAAGDANFGHFSYKNYCQSQSDSLELLILTLEKLHRAPVDFLDSLAAEGSQM